MSKKFDKLKILIIGPFPNPITGLSLANQILFDNLNGLGYEATSINSSLKDFEEKTGNFTLNKLLYFLKINTLFYKIFKNDIVYITPGQTFLGVSKYALFIMLSKILKKKIIVHIHGNVLYKNYESLSGCRRKILHFLLSMADRGIVLSPSLKKNLIEFIDEDKIFIVPNFVQKQFIATKAEIKAKDFSEVRIIFLSNLMTQKGVLNLFKALGDLNKKGFNYKAKIAGNIDNSIKPKINNYLKKLESVEYLGIIEGNEKENLLRWGNIFVFPSLLEEGLPISILEAMASGCIIISTPHAALKDYFSNKSINFIEKDSINSIKKEILNFKNLANYEIIESNHNFIEENCLEKQFTYSLLKILT